MRDQHQVDGRQRAQRHRHRLETLRPGQARARRAPHTGSVSTRRPSISISTVECPSQVARSRCRPAAASLRAGLPRQPLRHPPPSEQRNSLGVGRGAVVAQPGSTGWMLRKASPCHSGEARMRSRRSPAARLPSDFIVASSAGAARCSLSKRRAAIVVRTDPPNPSTPRNRHERHARPQEVHAAEAPRAARRHAQAPGSSTATLGAELDGRRPALPRHTWSATCGSTCATAARCWPPPGLATSGRRSSAPPTSAARGRKPPAAGLRQPGGRPAGRARSTQLWFHSGPRQRARQLVRRHFAAGPVPLLKTAA